VCDSIKGVSTLRVPRYGEHVPFSAFSNRWTSLLSEAASSRSFPTSPCRRSSYSSSFSVCRRRARCSRAVVALLPDACPVPSSSSVAVAGLWAAVICGSSTARRAGGSGNASSVEGGGWVERYWRRYVSSSYGLVSMEFRRVEEIELTVRSASSCSRLRSRVSSSTSRVEGSSSRAMAVSTQGAR
jgi:hypothetical protein